jgi:lipoprotein-anchoring transpeptidase ErfK/SrfK
MRTKVILGLVLASAGLLAACATVEPAANSDSAPPIRPIVETTAPDDAPVTTPVTLPPLPEVAEAGEEIVKTVPKPPPGVPCTGAADACVDLSANKTWLLSDGQIVFGPVSITSGRSGFETPPGTFKVGWKNKDHVSSIYDAPMPYSVFFNGGIAFHEGSLSEKSHGCIHLDPGAAKKYFGELSVGDTVEVVS